jgi:hypothetical protein
MLTSLAQPYTADCGLDNDGNLMQLFWLTPRF